MVSAELFEFISNMFAAIYNNTIAFRNINVIIVSDLTQLSYVTDSLVFRSSVWKLFYSLFLRQPHRQQNQTKFYNILQNIHLENIIDEIWEKLQRKY